MLTNVIRTQQMKLLFDIILALSFILSLNGSMNTSTIDSSSCYESNRARFDSKSPEVPSSHTDDLLLDIQSCEEEDSEDKFTKRKISSVQFSYLWFSCTHIHNMATQVKYLCCKNHTLHSNRLFANISSIVIIT